MNDYIDINLLLERLDFQNESLERIAVVLEELIHGLRVDPQALPTKEGVALGYNNALRKLANMADEETT